MPKENSKTTCVCNLKAVLFGDIIYIYKLPAWVWVNKSYLRHRTVVNGHKQQLWFRRLYFLKSFSFIMAPAQSFSSETPPESQCHASLKPASPQLR